MGSFFSGLLDWFAGSGIVSAIGDLIAFIWNALVWVWNVLVAVITNLVAALKYIFGKIGGAFRWLWDNAIKGPLTKLANAIIRVHQWLEDHLAPVLRFLQKVRAYIDRIFRTYIRPILVIIQQVRRVLLVLRLLHIKFAQQLDNILAQVQADISRVFLTIRGTLNAVIDVVNAIADPSRMSRIIAGSVAGRRAAAGIARMVLKLPIGFFFPNYRSDAPPWEKPVLRAADLRDATRNPLAGTFFDSFAPLPVSDFLAGDPTPSDATLNAAEPLPFGDDLYLSFLAAEAGVDAMSVDDGTLASAVQQRLGVYYEAGQEIALAVTVPV